MQLVGDPGDEHLRALRNIDVLELFEPACRIEREVRGLERQLAAVADERRVEGELGVLVAVAHVGLELAGAAGLVVDQLLALAAAKRVDAIDAPVELDPAELGRPSAELDFATLPRGAAPLPLVQPRDVAWREHRERGTERQEAGFV